MTPIYGSRLMKDVEILVVLSRACLIQKGWVAELRKARGGVVEREVLPFDHTDLSRDVTSLGAQNPFTYFPSNSRRR